jgi:hypothetical protein
VNRTVATGTGTGIQRSYHVSFEAGTGNTALAVYSNGVDSAYGKKYDAATNAWDANGAFFCSLFAPPLAPPEAFRTIADPVGDDIMILFSDSDQDMYSQVWDGASNDFYQTSGKGCVSHGFQGSSDLDFWFDFAWDRHY